MDGYKPLQKRIFEKTGKESSRNCRLPTGRQPPEFTRHSGSFDLPQYFKYCSLKGVIGSLYERKFRLGGTSLFRENQTAAAEPVMVSKGEQAPKVDIQANCMDWMRLCAAVAVVYGHGLRWLCPPGFGFARSLDIVPGLIVFFVISGFLITASMERKLLPWPGFLWRRFVRIYPGMWAAFFVSGAVVVPAVHAYGIDVSLVSWFKWAVAQLTFFQFYTPADLKAYGIGNPNGVLWMIPLMLCMYVLMRSLYPRLRNAGMLPWVLFLSVWVGLALLAHAAYGHLPLLWQKLLFVSFLPYAYIFFLGMFLCRFRERLLPFLRKWWLLPAGGYVVWVRCKAFWHIPVSGLYLDVVSGCLICLLSVAIAYRFKLPRMRHDYSYALFLYHEIFINLFVMWGYTRSWGAFLAVFACTIPCAVLSCRLVEEPAARRLLSFGGK